MNKPVLDKSNVELKIHNNTQYMLIDFSGLDNDGIISLTLEISSKLVEAGVGKTRFITDLSGLGKNVNSYSLGRNFAKSHQKYLYKSAVIGLPAWLKPIYNVFMKFTGSKARLFSTKEEAVDYVCS